MATVKTSERARALLKHVEAIKTAIEEAEREAASLLRDVEESEHSLVRMYHAVHEEANALVHCFPGGGSEFEPDLLVESARDLVELSELAETPQREIVAAA
jgi:hypothetical protein